MKDENIKQEDSNSTIFVGGLKIDVVDSDVYKLFSKIGSIVSMKIIKPSGDNAGKYSSAYAYITYGISDHAREAVDKLNFCKLNDVEMRVMSCDKSKIKGNIKANVFVKNLPKDCDNKTLYDTFSMFGEVISCKVSTSNTGEATGFGFVQYKDKTSAKKAVLFGSNSMMGSNKIKVEKYDKSMKESRKEMGGFFTNVFFKNIPLNSTEETIKPILEKYGEISSFFLPMKENGECKGFGFANFKENSNAVNAIKELHDNKIFEDVPEKFYIQKAQLKHKREEELKKEMEKLSISGQNFKRNLYVKNIPLEYGEESINEIFNEFGNITSILVEKDTIFAEDKNYAFICYSTPDEAAIAVEKGNDLILDGNKLQVSFFKSKKERIYERSAEHFGFNSEVPLMYHGLKPYGTSTLIFKKPEYNRSQRKIFDKKQLSSDLYTLVLSLAPTFQDKWRTLGIKDEKEFASKITNLLMEKSGSEVRNMIGLGNVLTQNISETLSDIRENKEKKEK